MPVIAAATLKISYFWIDEDGWNFSIDGGFTAVLDYASPGAASIPSAFCTGHGKLV